MSQAKEAARILIESQHDGQLLRITKRIRQTQAASVLVDLVECCYRVRAFNHAGQALDLVAAVTENHAAGVYSEIDFGNEPAGGLTVHDYHYLTSLELAALLCLAVVYLLECRCMGPTQVKLLTRDCETAIACAKDDTPAA